MESVGQVQPHGEAPLSHHRQIFSLGQGSRGDRWMAIASAAVLSLASVLTAWCGYQASMWGGEQARAAAAATASLIMAAQRANTATLVTSMHVGLFVEYAAAVSKQDDALATFLYERFPDELRAATDAWLELEPLNNPDAPPSPFAVPEYHLTAEDEAEEYAQAATQMGEEASLAKGRSDKYVRLTVIFATVLFFGGIGGKFQWRVIDGAMLIIGALVMLTGLWLILQSPVLWS